MNLVNEQDGAFDALQALHKVIEKGGVPRATLELTNLRASQINGIRSTSRVPDVRPELS